MAHLYFNDHRDGENNVVPIPRKTCQHMQLKHAKESMQQRCMIHSKMKKKKILEIRGGSYTSWKERTQQTSQLLNLKGPH